jgi:uncharacterized protein (DUF2147 family)
MNKWKWISSLLVMIFFIPVVLAQTPAGNWVTRDDQTGKKRAIIKIDVSGSTLNASIDEIFPEPGDLGVCHNCPGHFKGKPIKGLEFVWGLKDKGNGEWDDGKILDPKTGKIYRGKMTLKGDKLYVRGYLGVSLLGRTQVWTRN